MNAFRLIFAGTLVHIAAPALASEFTFCRGAEAINAAGDRIPGQDWICALPDGTTTGEEDNVRCKNSTLVMCAGGAGGELSIAGPHDVPRDAWFYQGSARLNGGMIKCQCGCFTDDMKLLTTLGYIAFGEASPLTQKTRYRAAIAGEEEGVLVPSKFLVRSDFTVGPEEKAIFEVTAVNGSVLKMTENHPVLIVRDGERTMVQAKTLKERNTLLFGPSEEEVAIESVRTYRLPEGKNNVYNVDTRAPTARGHVIDVNGFKVGDVKWQTRLSALESREENLVTASKKE